jgi:hypothetical protein
VTRCYWCGGEILNESAEADCPECLNAWRDPWDGVMTEGAAAYVASQADDFRQGQILLTLRRIANALDSLVRVTPPGRTHG